MNVAVPIRMGVLGLAFSLSLVACTRTTPEQQLRAAIDRMQAGIEARDATAVKQALADDFIGPGGLDRSGAVRLAQLAFLQNAKVGATFGPLQIQWFPSAAAPDHASVEFNAVLTGGAGAVLPDQAQAYQVKTGWRREGDAWRLTSATWTP
jgi:ketosteroid isomerase-like protein